MSTPPQVASWKSEKWCKENQYLTASEKNHNPGGVPRSLSGRIALIFLDSIGDPSGSPSDKPTNFHYSLLIIKPPSFPSENPTKFPSRVTK